MTRNLTSGMLTEVQAGTGTGVFLVELQFGSGTQRIATSSEPITWNGVTWTAVGGFLEVEALAETMDERDQGLRLRLSGVDQSLLSLILQEQSRGRLCRIYHAHLSSSGAVVDAPAGPWDYLMSGDWDIQEERPADGQGSVTIETRVLSRFASWGQAAGVQCTVESHSAMLARAGVLASGTRDTFFATMAKLAGRRVLWGTTGPGRTTGLLDWVYRHPGPQRPRP